MTVVHADCRDLDIAGLGAAAMITDPPYSPHVHDNAVSTRTDGVGPRDRDLGFDALTPELRAHIATAWAPHCARWSVVFTDFEGYPAWMTDMAAAGLEYIRPVPWVRWSQPQVSGDRPCTGAELVVLWHAQGPAGPRGGKPRPIRKHWNGYGGMTHYSALCMRGQDKHPTEKPLDLMLELVSSFSDPGELVVDPFAGRGTTALAALLLGRDCLACEADAQEATLAGTRERAILIPRDRDRAVTWAKKARAEAESIPAPEEDSEVPTWERAQRRLADVERVEAAL